MENFQFNKKFGQNFLSDKNLLTAIVNDSGLSNCDEVLEIGAGAGALTDALSQKAKKVVSYEIDKKLTEILSERFCQVKNVEIIMQDALKLDIKEIEKNFEGSYFIVANLPYYITTPLIFKFLEETNRAKVITIMVQKEVAQKIVSKPSDENYGILTVMLNHYCDAKITRIVKKQMFHPQPKVDSAVIRLTRKDNVSYDKNFKNFVSGCFAMKRKTLTNNLLQQGFSRDLINQYYEKFNVPATVRAESLSYKDICQMFSFFNKERQ